MFNFDLKTQTYNALLAATKNSFLNDDLESGLENLDQAISVCKELINNCIIAQVKSNYETQLRKLNSIRKKVVEENYNPFIKTALKVNQETNQNEQKSENSPKNEVKSQYFSKDVPNVTLKDVAGLDDVKEQIKLNVIAPLKNPDIYFKYTDQVGCRILMYGPPGCGKSFIAEAIAGELKCAYAIINSSDILDKYVGTAPKRIKEIFEEASNYDNCLIFFDELDALFASRESDDSSHTKDVLTSFLTCLSGFQTSKNDKKIRVIIGATNRPWILDSALLRGKRLDTHIYIGLPDYDARKFIISKEFKNRESLITNTDITIDELVDLLDGYSGADISSIVNKIKMKALERALENRDNEENKEYPVTKEDALEVISNYRNSITPESLEAFEDFKKGVL